MLAGCQRGSVNVYKLDGTLVASPNKQKKIVFFHSASGNLQQQVNKCSGTKSLNSPQVNTIKKQQFTMVFQIEGIWTVEDQWNNDST